MTIYTATNQPELPREVGLWVRLDRCLDTAKPTYRLTFENAVGGSIGYRFATKTAAVAYSNRLCAIRQQQAA